MSRKRSGLFLSARARAAKAIADSPYASETAQARLAAAALLELARARHHLRRASGHLPRVTIDPKTGKTKVGLSPHPLSEVSAMNHLSIAGDLPAELSSYSDGVTDDAAYHPEIIGCGLPGLHVQGGLADVAIGAHRGIPGYLLTRAHLNDRTVRGRIADSIRKMTPKLRRRVLHRLQQAVMAARAAGRVSGEIRNAYPTVAGGWGAVSGQAAVGRCPYANVAGPLTP